MNVNCTCVCSIKLYWRKKKKEDLQLCCLETQVTGIRSERDAKKKPEPEIKQYVQLLITKDATESKSVYAKCFGSYFWSKRESKF